MNEPDLRRVAIELAELTLRGIDVNLACTEDGGTFLHGCVLLRDPAIALDNVRWLLQGGAEPAKNRWRNADEPRREVLPDRGGGTDADPRWTIMGK
jgi:hypothetical protein